MCITIYIMSSSILAFPQHTEHYLPLQWRSSLLLVSLWAHYFQVDYISLLYLPLSRTGSTTVTGLANFQVDEVACDTPT